MSWAGIDVLQIYLGQDCCGWIDASGTGHWHEDGDFESRFEQCMTAASMAWPKRALRRPSLKLWASGALIRPFLLGPVAGLKGTAEIRSFVQSQVRDATGWDEACEVRLEGDVTKGIALATAMPTALHARLEALVKDAGLNLTALRPWWAAALGQALSAYPGIELLAIEDTESLVLLAGHGANWAMAEALTPKPPMDEAERTVLRLAAGAGTQISLSAWLRLSVAEPVDAFWPPAKSLPVDSRS